MCGCVVEKETDSRLVGNEREGEKREREDGSKLGTGREIVLTE